MTRLRLARMLIVSHCVLGSAARSPGPFLPCRSGVAQTASQPVARGRRRRCPCRCARPRVDRSSSRERCNRTRRDRSGARRRRCSSSTPTATSCRRGAAPAPDTNGRTSNTAIYVDHDDHVWLGAGGEKDAHLLKFTRDGKFLLQIGRKGRNGGSNDTREPGRRRQRHRRPRGQRSVCGGRLRQPSGDRLRRDDRRVQAALGRVRQAARRRVLHARGRAAAEPVQRRGSARERAEPVRP